MPKKVLFLCPHNAAKSVLALAYFRQLTADTALKWIADSAGTEPSAVTAPAVVELLHSEGMNISDHIPRHLTAHDLETADLIISMGCQLDNAAVQQVKVQYWNEVPPVSQHLMSSRNSIRQHIEQLIEDLKQAES